MRQDLQLAGFSQSAKASNDVRFESFHLDAVNQCLWRENEQISLTPKAFSVLQYLANRPGRLVTKQELLDAVWPEIHVTEGVLKRAVVEIRKALSDSVEEPTFIQTLHRRGYRFLPRTTTDSATAPVNPGYMPEGTRELSAAIAALSAEGPLVSVLQNLQGDTSAMDLLTAIARLMIMATNRRPQSDESLRLPGFPMMSGALGNVQLMGQMAHA